MTDLKPCPFCGGEAVSVGWSDFDSGVIFFECGSCGMYCEPKDCYADEQKAIAAWNTRAERTCHKVIPDEMEGYVFCSECGAEIGEYGYPNYCPNCGAKVIA